MSALSRLEKDGLQHDAASDRERAQIESLEQHARAALQEVVQTLGHPPDERGSLPSGSTPSGRSTGSSGPSQADIARVKAAIRGIMFEIDGYQEEEVSRGRRG